MQSILDHGVDTELGKRNRALVDYAVKLTNTPDLVGAADLVPLRQIGLTDLEILTWHTWSPLFTWANCLMQSLGHVVYGPVGEG